MADNEYEKELDQKANHDYYVRVLVLVSGILGSFTLTAIAMSFFWDLFATDVHLPEVHFSGAVGVLGLILILIALIAGTYVVAIRDWGE
jgi:cytochrome c biogenesis protein CcdA